MNAGGQATPGALADDGARIVDRGYQHYTGERRGIAWSVLAITTGSMRRSLGFKRPGSAKVLPFLLVLFAFFPGIAVVGFRVLFPVRVLRRVAAPDQFFTYNSYFIFLRLVVLLLAALAAAEALCPDRRQRVLSLYYASPIRPLLYLLGQVLAVAAVLLLVALLPPLLLWVANVGLADDSLPYLRDHLDQAVRILATGSLLALLYAALGLAVASFTDRRAYAAGTLLGGALVISAAAGIVRGVTKERWAEYTGLIDPLYLPTRLTRWIFGLNLQSGVQGYLFLLAALVMIIIALAVIVRSYRGVRF